MNAAVQISTNLQEEKFTPAQFTLIQDPLFSNLLFSIKTNTYRWVNGSPSKISHDNQLWYVLQSFVAAEILRGAYRMSVIAERELTTLAPKKVRDAAVSWLKNENLIEQTKYKKSTAFSLTAAGRNFLQSYVA